MLGRLHSLNDFELESLVHLETRGGGTPMLEYVIALNMTTQSDTTLTWLKAEIAWTLRFSHSNEDTCTLYAIFHSWRTVSR